MGKLHVVTGATGFVGLALVLELLRRTEDEVVCVVRPDRGDPAPRLQKLLAEAAAAYGHPQAGIASRVKVAPGDIRQPWCGVSELPDGRVAGFWHSAASLKFDRASLAEIEATNVDGTRHALELADKLGADSFQYISTAYVAGTRNGVIGEQLFPEDLGNNEYERSKVRAEELVFSHGGTPTRILRPSIVMGHSRTHAVVGSYTGIYGLHRRLAMFRNATASRDPQRLERSHRVVVDPQTPLNMIPVDAVVRDAVTVGLAPAGDRIFHLTNSTPPSVATVMEVLFDLAGLRPPAYATDVSELDSSELVLHKRIEFYRAYLVGSKLFDRGTTDQVVGGREPGSSPMRRQEVRAYGLWYRDTVLRREPAPKPEPEPEPRNKTRVVLLGGGYTSMWAYRGLRLRMGAQLRSGALEVTYVDPLGYHCFHGFTAEVLGGMIADGNERSPLRVTCPKAGLVRGRAVALDTVRREVTVELAGGPQVKLPYDHLVIGCGSHDDMSRIPGLAESGWSLKNPGGRTALRDRLLAQVELADATDDPVRQQMLLTVVVAGAGFAGAEMAAAIAEMFATMRRRYRVLQRVQAQVHLVHSGEHILPSLRPRFSRLAGYAQRQLTRIGVTVHLRTSLREVTERSAHLSDGTVLDTGLVVSTIGQRVWRLPGTEGFEVREGRLVTDEHLHVAGESRIWVGGDHSYMWHPVKQAPCPENALWAIKHGTWIGANIAASIRGRRLRRFDYRGLGQAASFGVGKGIVELYGLQFTGWLAWLMRAGLFLWFMPSRRQAVRCLTNLIGTALLGRRYAPTHSTVTEPIAVPTLQA